LKVQGLRSISADGEDGSGAGDIRQALGLIGYHRLARGSCCGCKDECVDYAEDRFAICFHENLS
jgi:hypothetical protein